MDMRTKAQGVAAMTPGVVLNYYAARAVVEELTLQAGEHAEEEPWASLIAAAQEVALRMDMARHAVRFLYDKLSRVATEIDNQRRPKE